MRAPRRLELSVATVALILAACGSRTPLLLGDQATSDAGTTAPDTGTSPPCALAAGAAATLASYGGPASDLSVDATNLYWLAGSSVLALPICGGSITTLAQVPYALGLTSDATSLYAVVSNHGSPMPPYSTQIVRVDKATGVTSTLSTAPLPGGVAVAVDATNV
jgi:hypothetical protein